MRRAAIRAASKVIEPDPIDDDGEELDETDEENNDDLPEEHSAEHSAEDDSEEEEEDDSEEEDADEDDEDDDQEDEDEEEEEEEEEDPHTSAPIVDEWRVPPLATHWTLRRQKQMPDGRWINDGDQLEYGQVDGVPIRRWPITQWEPATILKRWGPGDYQPVFVQWKKATQRFFIAGKGMRITLLPPQAERPAEDAAPPAPRSFAEQVMGPVHAPAPMAPVHYAAATSLAGWDAESAKYLADISPEMRGQLAAMRLLQDDQEKRARVAIEGERERARQHLEAMAQQQRMTLELFAIMMRPQQAPAAAPPPPAPAPPAFTGGGLPDFTGLATVIAQVQALAQQTLAAHAPPPAQPAAEIVPSAVDEAQAQADRTQQLVMAGASIVANLAEVAKTFAPMFMKPAGATAEAAAAAATAAAVGT